VLTEADLDRLKARASEIAAAEGKRLTERTRESARMFEQASAYLPLGVASSFQTMDPYPIYLASGAGSRLWDVDGNAYLDYHNGFGVTLCGHAHPKIVEAIDRAARNGTHFAAMTEAAVTLAAELCRRFRLDRVRFANSGTESTMEAIRIARAATGRSLLVKAEGAYHGHHDRTDQGADARRASAHRRDRDTAGHGLPSRPGGELDRRPCHRPGSQGRRVLPASPAAELPRLF
jgi:glutamate-1-semialdehyde 2,1-aminomutase